MPPSQVEDTLTVPDTFCHFSGFRKPERQKKLKLDSAFLHQEELKAHGSALYNLAVSSYLKKDAWKPIQTSIVSLADSLVFCTFLTCLLTMNTIDVFVLQARRHSIHKIK